MEGKGFPRPSHRRSSARRLLEVLSGQSGHATGDSSNTGGDFSEDDVLWINDLVEPNSNFRSSENNGILATLPDSDLNMAIESPPLLNRKTSFPSPIKAVPAIPRPPHMSTDSKHSQSLPIGKFHQSAPMNVPGQSRARRSTLAEADDEEEEDEMLPPHEIVARASGRSPRTTASVLEGVGRTLKGRDLRQVRNAVWRKTGFLD